MYEEFYKFTGKPFQLNPDPKFFYRSKGHLRAMAYLRYGLQQGQGFIVVTGDVGTGKTMLVNNLFMEIAGKGVTAAKIVSRNVSEHDLLRLVAASFELPFERRSKALLLRDLEQYFRSCVEEGRRVLLVIDEAQNLPRSSLEELRMLSNFDHNGQPLVQSFLLGQREFRATMRSPGLEQLRQRVIAAFHLKPLNDLETADYILHRLRTVGWNNDPILDPEVLSGIHAFTRGVPRRINTLMDRMLLTGALDEQHRITAGQFELVKTEIELERGDADDDIPVEAEVRAAEPPATARGSPPAAAPAVANPQSAEMRKLEQRLVAMQHTMDNMTRRLEVQMRGPPPLPPGMHDPPTYGRPPMMSGLPSVWSLVIGIGIAILAVAGIAAFMLLRGSS